jgi:prevent-host-death family protein
MRPPKARSERNRSPSKTRRKALPRELDVGEAKALFSRLVDEAARGGRFVIAKAGMPVAKIVPLGAAAEKFVFSTLRGLLSRRDEQTLTEAIEAPLPDEVVAAFRIGPLGAPDK